LGEHLYLVDFIPLVFSARRIDPGKLRDLYVKRGLSSARIGDQVGLSKQAVLSRLRNEGIRETRGRGRDSNSFRYPFPPYGQRVTDGRLTIDRKEMKVVRLVIELRDRKSWGWAEIISCLNERGYRSRTGLLWNRVRVKRLHKYWSGKLLFQGGSMPSFKELAGIITTIVVLSVASGHGEWVWKGITTMRHHAVREVNHGWGCPSIFKRNVCSH
jgi:hypothetical protein